MTDPLPAGNSSDRLREFIREHAVFIGLLVVYFSAAAIYFVAIGRWNEWTIRRAYPLWAIAAITFSSARLLFARLRRRGASSLWRWEAIVGALLVIAVIVPFQTTFSSIKRTMYDVRGFPWDPALAEVDRLVHGGHHPWEWLVWMAKSRHLADWLDRLYLWWFPAVTLFLFWAAWTPWARLRQRALISTVLVWMVCGNVAAFAFASAGPCYYRFVVPDGPDPYERLLGTLDLYARDGLSIQARAVQRTLWNASTQDPIAPFRGISAMPSVHVAMAVLMALVGWARHRLAGAVLAMYAGVVLIGSVVLGWHYAIDGYVGGVMAVGIWQLSAALVPASLADRDRASNSASSLGL